MRPHVGILYHLSGKKSPIPIWRSPLTPSQPLFSLRPLAMVPPGTNRLSAQMSGPLGLLAAWVGMSEVGQGTPRFPPLSC